MAKTNFTSKRTKKQCTDAEGSSAITLSPSGHRACDHCRKRKVRCETVSGGSSCKACSKRNLTCQYEEPPKCRGRKKKRAVEESTSEDISSVTTRPRIAMESTPLITSTSSPTMLLQPHGDFSPSRVPAPSPITHLNYTAPQHEHIYGQDEYRYTQLDQSYRNPRQSPIFLLEVNDLARYSLKFSANPLQ
ncbi:hypothetical protein K502DRAFT_350302 [Neoconidiobolus thromboides FSU 785]|nr:hypothetical protein K502DRAFT_350302 [Neoconidiobolus thromboides FSU 785]